MTLHGTIVVNLPPRLTVVRRGEVEAQGSVDNDFAQAKADPHRRCASAAATRQ